MSQKITEMDFEKLKRYFGGKNLVVEIDQENQKLLIKGRFTGTITYSLPLHVAWEKMKNQEE